MYVGYLDSDNNVMFKDRRRPAHMRRRRGHRAAATLAAGAAITASILTLNATLGTVSYADGMPSEEALAGPEPSSEPMWVEQAWMLDLPAGFGLAGLTAPSPLALPPHMPVVMAGPVKGLERPAPVSQTWVSTVRDEAEKTKAEMLARQPRRLLCDDGTSSRTSCEGS